MNLQQILFSARAKLKDLGMKRWRESELVAAANEGKNVLVQLIRQARQDYFEISVSITIPVAVAPNASEATLPADFVQVKDLEITTADYEWIQFLNLDRTDPRFKYALREGGTFLSGEGTFFYDIVGKTKIVFSPGSDIALACKLSYIQNVADMAYPTDTPSPIPVEYHDFIVSFIVCECQRETNDPQLVGNLDKLQRQKESIAMSVADLQVREPNYVRGFMEGEW